MEPRREVDWVGSLRMMAAVAGGALCVLWFWRPGIGASDTEVVAAALFCGAAAAGTAPAGLFLLRQEVRMSGPMHCAPAVFATPARCPRASGGGCQKLCHLRAAQTHTCRPCSEKLLLCFIATLK